MELVKDRLSQMWYKFTKSRVSVVGLIIVIFVIVLAVGAPSLAPYPEHAGPYVNFSNASRGPCRQHWFGTDVFGRDILSRVLFAYRNAMIMAVGVLAVIVPVGVVLGLIAGYMQNSPIEIIVMRIADIFLALPPLILALAICSVLRPTLGNAMIAICVSWWAWYTRLTYSMVTSLRDEFYVKAAEVTGASRFHIMFREILPNCLSPLLTKMTLEVGWIILAGASLSFIGLGEQPPKPALGTMVSDGAKYLPHYWWIAMFPALAIMLVVLGFNLLGDGLRDMLASEEV